MKRRDPACTQAQFMKDVAQHEMQVLHDDGVYRHIRFREPDSMMQHFDLVTYPGHLVYSGDMGTYVFERLTDMFTFFRVENNDGRLRINLGYWSEKLQAVDGSRSGGSAKEFSEDRFAATINEYRLDWMRDSKRTGKLDKDQRRELWEAVNNDVLGVLSDYQDGTAAQIAAHEFSYRIGGKAYCFRDLFEHDFTEYTHRFIWCCYALAWGVQKYDTHKAALAPAAQAVPA